MHVINMADFNGLTLEERRLVLAEILKQLCGGDYCGQLASCNSCALRQRQLFDLAKWSGN